MKRVIIAVLLSCSIICVTYHPLQVKAATLGTLNCWYSATASTIGRWDQDSVYVYVNKLNSNSSFELVAHMTNGCSQWGNALGVSLNVTQTDSTAPIKYYGGGTFILFFYGFSVTSDVNGQTNLTATNEGTWTYGQAIKTGMLISGVSGCIVDNMSGSGRTTTEIKETCIHELGHAMGWYGHSSATTDIMNGNGSSVVTLTYRDKNHLSQVY